MTHGGTAIAPEIVVAPFDRLDPATVYSLCVLRTDVFVREQKVLDDDELDGRDLEPDTTHYLALDGAGRVISALRVLDSDAARVHIGRVLTARDARGRGLSSRLVEAAVRDFADREIGLGAQIRLESWYAGFGFERCGDDYLDAGLVHAPMLRKPTVDPGRAWRPAARLHQPARSIAPATGGVPISPGWNGTRVRALQRRLGIERTGSRQSYDDETVAAVTAAQEAAGLPATGIIDARAWDALDVGVPFDADGWQTTIAVPPYASRDERIEQMIAFARAQHGSPYAWGGAGPYELGFDCSGLVVQALYSAGLDPQPISVVDHAGPSYRTSRMLYLDDRMESHPLEERERGDLIFYTDDGGRIMHIVIYLGVTEDGRDGEDGSGGTEMMCEAIAPEVHDRPYVPQYGSRYVAPVIRRPFA